MAVYILFCCMKCNHPGRDSHAIPSQAGPERKLRGPERDDHFSQNIPFGSVWDRSYFFAEPCASPARRINEACRPSSKMGCTKKRAFRLHETHFVLCSPSLILGIWLQEAISSVHPMAGPGAAPPSAGHWLWRKDGQSWSGWAQIFQK